MSLGMSLLFAFLGLAAIMAGSCRYYAWLMERLVNGRLRDLNTIRATELPPIDWHSAMNRKLERHMPIGEDALASQWKRDIKRLDGVIRFANKTHLMEDEQTREGIIEDLRRIRRDWQDHVR